MEKKVTPNLPASAGNTMDQANARNRPSWIPSFTIGVGVGCILVLLIIVGGLILAGRLLSSYVPQAPSSPMVLIPVGEFTMGSDNGAENQRPANKVYLNSFYMDKYEVTNSLYKACVDAGACSPPNKTSSSTHPGYFGNPTFDNYPVINVYFLQAEIYCRWRGARLPTEAEWEKAARGTDGRLYPWGNEIDCSHANYNGCIGDATNVFNYESGASPYSVYGMAGDVWEWVSSLYKQYPYNAVDGREDPNANGSRVVRGGSWKLGAVEAMSVYRIGLLPIAYDDNTGFRCVSDTKP